MMECWNDGFDEVKSILLIIGDTDKKNSIKP